MNIVDDGQRIEFVCDRCLHSVMARDTAKPPRCPRCGIKLTPDSDEPRPRTHVAGGRSQAAPGGRRTATPAATARRSLAGL
jgi:hypothetical protein